MTASREMEGADVIVVGSGNSAGQAAVHLARFARSVTIMVRRFGLTATMSHYLVNEIGHNPRIEILGNARVVDGGGDRRLVQTFTWEGMPEAIALETMTFEDLGDGTTRLHAFSLCHSFEARDAMLASGMEVGIHQGYRKLDTLLADGTA